jgi:ADP-heptose:LPS heptosyltransferase
MLDLKKTHKLPFKYDIPNYLDKFLGRRRELKASIKYLKRYLFITLIRQKKLESYSILPSHKIILWINISAPSLGDSLMDLSSRVMIKDKEIDLFTDKYNEMIYKSDVVFSSVFSETNQINSKKYDLVIIDSFSTRSIRIKAKVAKSTPFVAMFGYYNGPEVNRVLFSFHRMNSLLAYKNNESEISKIAKPSMFISKEDYEIIEGYNLPKEFISVVIGGEWSFRTFNEWDKVIEKLISLNNDLNIVLIGSDNAIKDAQLIIDKLPSEKIINYVSKFSFNQTAEIINRAQYTICCDGGLMHAANAVDQTIIVLLAKLNSDMQLTEANRSFFLFDESNVNNISVESIVKKCQEANKSIKYE